MSKRLNKFKETGLIGCLNDTDGTSNDCNRHWPDDHIFCGCPWCGQCFCEKCKEYNSRKKMILIHFKSVEDFRNRIADLWQKQKDEDIYEFTFENQETLHAYIEFIKCFESS